MGEKLNAFNLNARQEAFVNAYCSAGCKGAEEAAKIAGYSEKTAASIGSRLLKNVKVQRAIDALRVPAKEQSIADAAYVFKNLMRVIEVGSVLYPKLAFDGEQVTDDNGRPVWKMTDAGAVNAALRTLTQALGLGKEKSDKDQTIQTLAETLKGVLKDG